METFQLRESADSNKISCWGAVVMLKEDFWAVLS